MKVNEEITEFLKGLTDNELKEILKEYFEFHYSSEQANPDTHKKFKALIKKICDFYGHPFSISLGESFLFDETLRRFLNK